MASSPAFAATPKNGSVVISTANTNRDGTGTLGTLHPAGALGARIDKVRIQALGTTTAGMIRFFIGTTLILEVPVIGVTAAATSPVWGADVIWDGGLVLQASNVLKVSTNNAESFALNIINGGDI